MPAYHSSFLSIPNVPTTGNLAMLPLKTKFRGPAYPADANQMDIIDECITLFRANCFFRNFEIKGPADRTLIYGTLFISECLGKLTGMSYRDAERHLNSLALENFSIPGSPGFPLNALYSPPVSPQDSELMRSYLTQFRQELAFRLLSHVYATEKTQPSKWWTCFSKRRFMNKAL
ncbi:ARP2/3 actin-organizing complex subunit Arc21 [Schizosaccharomyces cryophilus OY26]|uniref:Actin-related protein 2/3 complex subunit 3 n=1 Tax=Schizosaccharomyces cryophilus (strain OY26 / ATCC MYA-4695 / CBS 11777 / NBRC 106824 / NRRL Y48691) TaxID=653667 RepID=S9XA35_SCHCR|nr:ARP2/3 actin-organizing complex subunit Arc21 [Schizosaccharomyces cryophilus OY26]EPY53997.1 ARP2/3 actin-organizing complex subunit Arc21 [Schizosaccharomyces cryophilus OY26]